MGWATLFALIAASALALWMMGVRRGLFQAAAAALLFGATGYALQGHPGLAGSPAGGSSTAEIVPLTQARHAFYGNFTGEESWLRMSEGLARSGNSEDAVNILTNAVHRYPRNAQLWVGLGNALVDHSRGLTPPAVFAYERASELSPGYPGPGFFYGLALARSGDRQGAVTVWTQILANAPAKASWRPLVERGIAALGSPVAP
jgi:cytochrome c-type biogenesis protein CcmH